MNLRKDSPEEWLRQEEQSLQETLASLERLQELRIASTKVQEFREAIQQLIREKNIYHAERAHQLANTLTTLFEALAKRFREYERATSKNTHIEQLLKDYLLCQAQYAGQEEQRVVLPKKGFVFGRGIIKGISNEFSRAMFTGEVEDDKIKARNLSSMRYYVNKALVIEAHDKHARFSIPMNEWTLLESPSKFPLRVRFSNLHQK